MSAASAERPDGQRGAGDSDDEDTSKPATTALTRPDEDGGPMVGEEGSGPGEPPPCDPGDDDEYEPL